MSVPTTEHIIQGVTVIVVKHESNVSTSKFQQSTMKDKNCNNGHKAKFQKKRSSDHNSEAVKSSNSNQNDSSTKSDEDKRKIFVYRITEALTAKDLKLYFETFGRVRAVKIPKANKTVAIVKFVDRKIVKSVPITEHLIKGVRVIVAKYHKPTHCTQKNNKSNAAQRVKWQKKKSCDKQTATDTKRSNSNVNDDRKIFVGQITDSLSAEDLQDYFETFGRVKGVHIPKPRKNFCFVEFRDREVAEDLRNSGDHESNWGNHVIKGVHVTIG